ncbi:hypothetical protein L210DRAFT_3503138 [Boletus edulis BED1]|uniref:Uncharacterized protein n=1 Tax=Boletus edulis BED1 TaxID=1328754 RepID=A0AAD4BWL1_BOLED|nr:hypothetical protein L210DRAFT_3503138 [Boletus edulis BED1]
MFHFLVLFLEILAILTLITCPTAFHSQSLLGSDSGVVPQLRATSSFSRLETLKNPRLHCWAQRDDERRRRTRTASRQFWQHVLGVGGGRVPRELRKRLDVRCQRTALNIEVRRCEEDSEDDDEEDDEDEEDPCHGVVRIQVQTRSSKRRSTLYMLHVSVIVFLLRVMFVGRTTRTNQIRIHFGLKFEE